MREQLTNVTKDVASAMTQEVKGIASIITAEDNEEEDDDDNVPNTRYRTPAVGGGGGEEEQAGDVQGLSPEGEGFLSMHAHEVLLVG